MRKKVKVYIYEYLLDGSTQLRPPHDEADMKMGDILAVIQPPKKVDPNGWYVFAINLEGRTVTVRKKAIKKIHPDFVGYDLPPLTSHNGELSLQVRAVGEYMKGWEKKPIILEYKFPEKK